MSRDFQKLAGAVGRAAERYTNATALFQWAVERGEGRVPLTTHRYPDLVPTFGGSCLEQLKSIVTAGVPLRYLRSTRQTEGHRSIHYAGVCNVGGEEYLVDPNLSSVPVPLSEVRAGGEVAVETFPAVCGQRTRFTVRVEGENGIAVSQTRSGQEWRRESFDLHEPCTELPDVDVDVLSPLAHRMVILQVALPPEGPDREVVRIQRDCVGMGVKLLAAGQKMPLTEREAYLERVAAVLHTTRENLTTFLHEGYGLLEHLLPQKQALGEPARARGCG